MKKFILCIIGIGLLIYLLPFMLRGDLDILNPLAEEKMYMPLRKDMVFRITIRTVELCTR
ncbi:hypothetical protein B4087_3232 [Bacillus cereus]|nr:hypothetical protein B4087_3232 [Bacillus cereus]